MEYWIPVILVIALTLGISACEFFDSGEGYYHSPNEKFMGELKRKLDAKRFPYSVDKEGYLRFSPKDQAQFYEIESSIPQSPGFKVNTSWLSEFDGSDEFKKVLGYSKGLKSEDKKYMEILKQELKEEGFDFIEDKRGFVRYRAEDETRFKKTQALVAAMVSGKRGVGPAAGDIDHDFLKALKEALDSAGVGYAVDDAVVRYVSGDKQIFKDIALKLHKMYHLGDAARFYKEKKRKRLIHLLEEKKVDHHVLTNSHGTWVRWYPENKTQRDEIWRVVNSLGCGRSSLNKKESKERNSQTVLVQQMCSTLPERR